MTKVQFSAQWKTHPKGSPSNTEVSDDATVRIMREGKEFNAKGSELEPGDLFCLVQDDDHSRKETGAVNMWNHVIDIED